MSPQNDLRMLASPDLVVRYQVVRQQSMLACQWLEPDDFGLQAEAFTSPPKWHLAHTSWFFETFLLKPYLDGYQTPNRQYEQLFNSYYNGVGEQFSRAQRGLLSRPTIDEVVAYREHVDSGMQCLLENSDHPEWPTICLRVRLGIEHEQQHQELFYTDLKYSLSVNPLLPAYCEMRLGNAGIGEALPAQCWRDYEGGLVTVGASTDESDEQPFTFDNEHPAATVHLAPFALSNRLVTNAEFQAFVDDGGYQNHEYWLADGWAVVQEEQWREPLYWLQQDGQDLEFTLHGVRKRQPDAPVCHLSGYEADAYASWADARLPTEFEWEHAAGLQDNSGNTFDARRLHPAPASGEAPLLQLYSDCWQWTGSAYRPYPGFKPSVGAIGEYNGKFMANQWVLRGGSCVSQSGHLRPTYRNFFYPRDRWQFSGLRLARDL